MEDYEKVSAVCYTEGSSSAQQSTCTECGCYKGKPCTGSVRRTESSIASIYKEDETSAAEATPRTSTNVTPFVFLRNK